MFELLVRGIAAGLLYGLAALGFALVYNSTNIFHIAVGGVYVLAGYLTYSIAVLFQLPLIYTLILCLMVSALVGVAIEYFVYRPIMSLGGGTTACMIGSFGILIILQGLITLVYGNKTQVLFSGPLPTIQLAGVIITTAKLYAIATSIMSFIILSLFLNYTKLGMSIRAISNNPVLAETIGINVKGIRLVIFALGSALTALAAFFISLETGARPDMGFIIIMICANAVLIGGHGYLLGAAFGGLLLGIIEVPATYIFGDPWRNVIIFTIFIIILVFLPRGLFGKRMQVRSE